MQDLTLLGNLHGLGASTLRESTRVLTPYGELGHVRKSSWLGRASILNQGSHTLYAGSDHRGVPITNRILHPMQNPCWWVRVLFIRAGAMPSGLEALRIIRKPCKQILTLPIHPREQIAPNNVLYESSLLVWGMVLHWHTNTRYTYQFIYLLSLTFPLLTVSYCITPLMLELLL